MERDEALAPPYAPAKARCQTDRLQRRRAHNTMRARQREPRRSGHRESTRRVSAGLERDHRAIARHCRLGPRDGRRDGQDRPDRAARRAHEPHRLRGQRAARGVAADRRGRAALGVVGHRVLHEPALRHLQRTLAQVLRPSAARAAARAHLPRDGSQLRLVPAALPRAEACARADTVFLGQRVVELAELAGACVDRDCARRSCADRLGLGLRGRARTARPRVFDALGAQQLDRRGRRRGHGHRGVSSAAQAQHRRRDRRRYRDRHAARPGRRPDAAEARR